MACIHKLNVICKYYNVGALPVDCMKLTSGYYVVMLCQWLFSYHYSEAAHVARSHSTKTGYRTYYVSCLDLNWDRFHTMANLQSTWPQKKNTEEVVLNLAIYRKVAISLTF